MGLQHDAVLLQNGKNEKNGNFSPHRSLQSSLNINKSKTRGNSDANDKHWFRDDNFKSTNE